MVVSNDAFFREVDFERMQDVAGGSKRSEDGDRTTGAFGIGFISVYQITDRPEIRSAGQHWILRPDENEDFRIAEYDDPSMTTDKGTSFKLPWAFNDSRVRGKLKVPRVNSDDIDLFFDELKASLPRALLFVQKVSRIDLYRNSELVNRSEISRESDVHLVSCNGRKRFYRIIEGDFKDEAAILMDRYSAIERNRSCRVQIAIPDVALNDGLLFATLQPSNQRVSRFTSTQIFSLRRIADPLPSKMSTTIDQNGIAPQFGRLALQFATAWTRCGTRSKTVRLTFGR